MYNITISLLLEVENRWKNPKKMSYSYLVCVEDIGFFRVLNMGYINFKPYQVIV
jgi:hypothetical protein